MSHNLIPKLGIAALLAAAVFGAGSAAMWFLLAPITPDSLAAQATASATPITLQSYDDRRTVSIEFSPGPRTALLSTAEGRVTASHCSTGTALESGTALLDIDEKPYLVLATAMPLWRDIAPGDKGDDVRALQSELARLGSSVSADGIAGPLTVAAVTKLLRAADATTPELSAIPAARLIWIPGQTITPTTCQAALGDTVKVGDPLASLNPSLVKVSVQQLPTDLAPGEHNLTLDSVAVPLPSDGVIQDPSALERLATTRSFLTKASQNPKDAESKDTTANAVSAEITLANPIQISVVPPNAVYNIDGLTGCIASGGRGYPVTIVGSQLGQTYLLIDQSFGVQQVDLVSRSGPSCT